MVLIMRRALLWLCACMFFPAMLMASDVRFAGMGNISFLFEDEFNRLNLYDFAGMPASYLDVPDTLGTVMVRGSWLKEIWQHDSLTYTAIGQALPPKLIDYTPIEAAAALYTDIPVFDMSPTSIVYSSAGSREAGNSYSDQPKPGAWRMYLDYGQLSQSYVGDSVSEGIKTPAASFAYAKQITKTLNYGLSGDAFYGTFSSADGDTKASLFPVGLGGGVLYKSNNDRIVLAVNGDYHYPMVSLTSGSYTASYKGHAASPMLGTIVNLKNLTWISAADYKWMDLSGHVDANDIGHLKITGYSASSKIVLSMNPFRAAVLGQYDKRVPTYADEGGNLWYDAQFKEYGGGIGLGLQHKKVTIGVEGIGQQMISDDRELQESNKSQSLLAKIGLEYYLIKILCLRAGFNYEQLDPDLDASSDLVTSNIITGGGGLYLTSGMRLDVSYNYRMATTELDSDEKITDHSVKVFFKYLLKGESEGFMF